MGPIVFGTMQKGRKNYVCIRKRVFVLAHLFVTRPDFFCHLVDLHEPAEYCKKKLSEIISSISHIRKFDGEKQA